MLNPTWISGREENGRRIYLKIKSPLKYWTRLRSNSQPLYLQSDMHLQSDTLSSALRDPLKVLSHEMNVSFGVSKVNSIYVYIRPKHFLFSVTLTALIFWGLLFVPQRNFGRHIVIAMSVRQSVRTSRFVSGSYLLSFEVGIPILVCGYILGWQSVVDHFCVTVTLNLTSDLVFKNNRVRSISLILFEVGISNLVCGCILGWQSVAYHNLVTVTLNLTSDLVFRNCIESGAYLLYSLR